ncbi:hypothetical protein [Wukongibacter sp. M2B1]|uniref:hypothetical protein n=1 Tax=Wukongibacter sp. M2B1 TaxID=3088895 RepID=UPI003D7AEFDA
MRKFISFILILTLILGTTATSFADIHHDFVNMKILQEALEDQPIDLMYDDDSEDVEREYTAISFWDVTDFVMAFASWKDFFNAPSLGKFSWAALDTAALLPLLPSSAYFRRGSKIVIKADAVKDLAKTKKGSKAIKNALKTGTKSKVKRAAKTIARETLEKYFEKNVNKNLRTVLRKLKIKTKGYIDPKKVRFTQSSISKKFGNKDMIDEAIKGLKSGEIKNSDFNAIEVFELDGKIYSLDNRRLYVHQKSGKKIKYKFVSNSTVLDDFWKFTTKNDGTSIRVRN